MITHPKRSSWAGTTLPVRLVCLVVFSSLATTAHADELVTKIDEINHALLDSKIEAVQKALTSVRAIAADLVKNGDPRKEQVLAREDELEVELRGLQEQRKTNADPLKLRQLAKEFEAIEDRGGWWWLDEKKPDEKGPWYRLDRQKKRITHYFKDPQGNTAVSEEYSAAYEILGLANDNQNITLIKLTYPPKGTKPGDQAVMRFNRETGVIQSSYGWYGEPKK